LKRVLPKTRQFLERAASKTRRLFTPKVLKQVFLAAALFGVADTLISAVGWTYLGRSSPALLLSDLLFLEGSLILAIGTFIAVTRSWREPQSKTDQSTEESENNENPHFSVHMIIVGAMLIALSVVFGTLSTLI